MVEHTDYDKSYIHPEDVITVEEPRCSGKSQYPCAHCGKCLYMFEICNCKATTGFSVNEPPAIDSSLADLYDELGKVSWLKDSKWNAAVDAVREHIRKQL